MKRCRPTLDLFGPAVTFVTVSSPDAKTPTVTGCYLRNVFVGAEHDAAACAGMVRVAQWLGHEPEVRSFPAQRFAAEFGRAWPRSLRELTAS